MKKTRAMWQWRQPGTMQSLCRLQGLLWSWLLAGSESSFFFGPCTHSFSALIRYFLIPLLLQWKTVTVLLTTGSLPEVTLLAPALTQHPMPLDTVQSIYLNNFFFIWKGRGSIFCIFYKNIFKCIFYNNEEHILERHILWDSLENKKAESLI